ncbi:MAG: UDP-N-acetylglucosamine transferase subunit ALG13 [Granulosicoccus sp.]|jgi:UDP-N-acetylglucosamine transferase subunit ALG13
MILVTVGTQLPFDRLIKAVDQWSSLNPHHEVEGQFGDSSYIPENFSGSSFLDVSEFNAKVAGADLLIAHAGMGSIITAIEMMKPIVVMPRLARYGEHRNDHQLATVKKLGKLSNIHIAENDAALPGAIEVALATQDLHSIEESANRISLLSMIQSFLASSVGPQPLTNNLKST